VLRRKLDKHQLAPLIGEQDLYLSVFAVVNFVRNEIGLLIGQIGHTSAS